MPAHLSKLQNYIHGEFRDTLDYLESYNPSIGQSHLLIPASTEIEANEAVQSAARAFPHWSGTTRQHRSDMLMKIADKMEQRLEELAVAESRDQGKPTSLAKSVDIPRFFATYILHIESKATELDGIATNYVHRTPAGVAVLISPWNLPLYLLTWKIAPAIAFGCTCVCKPSEYTSLTAFMLTKIFDQVGLPPGVVNMVLGTGPDAGSALVKHPLVKLVSFTGGTATGQKIAMACAPQFKKVSLELGGKNANIIFADANLQKALQTSIRSSFANQGEICLCGSRIFVESSVYDSFLEAFVKMAKALKVGDPSASDTDLGALVSEEHLIKVDSYVKLAVQEGGRIECGGERLRIPIKTVDGMSTDGYFYPPTVITGLTSSSRVCQEEIFGPVVTVIPFDNEQQVIEWANSVEYGLSASIWTENIKRAKRVSESLHVGTAWINCWMVRDLNMPFGGMKSSGLGREGGFYSMEFFTQDKTICISNE